MVAPKRAPESQLVKGAAPKRQKRIPDDTQRLATAAVLSEAASNSYLSVRQLGSDATRVTSLASVCLQVIVNNFQALFLDAETGQVRTDDVQVRNAMEWLAQVPPRPLNRLLQVVLDASQESYGPRISTSALSSLFLRSGQITSFTLPPTYFRAAQLQYDPGQRLLNDPENILATVSGKPQQFIEAEQAALRRASKDRANLLQSLRSCRTLRSLKLLNQNKLQDEVLAGLLAELPQLQDVVLKGCTAVGDASVRALAKSAGQAQRLKTLNLNYTAVTVKGLRSMFARCKSLEVLKLSTVNGLNDISVATLVSSESYIPEDWAMKPFDHLRNLKLRSTKIGDNALKAWLPLCPALETLDISYTAVRSLQSLTDAIKDTNLTLQKLSLSGLDLRSPTMLDKLFKTYAQLDAPRKYALKTLKLGTLTVLDNPTLFKIMPHLEQLQGLEKVSLFGNDKLGTGLGSGLKRFIASVGRHCKVLDLSQIHISGRDLAPSLVKEEYEESGSPEPASPLRILILDNTRVDDEAAIAIAMLPYLEELYIEQAKITVDGMTAIMQGCPNLRIVNLKGCRGIPVTQRRDWFEKYENGEVGEED